MWGGGDGGHVDDNVPKILTNDTQHIRTVRGERQCIRGGEDGKHRVENGQHKVGETDSI